MPANLPPEYFDAEKRFREATSDQERVERIEELLGAIPKHKGTDKLRADYRRKLSQLRAGLLAAKKTGRHESAYYIEREGPARAVIVGVSNTGKSALLAAVTHAAPKISEYAFTTWIPMPGMMPVRDIQIQLIDTPALSREHIEPELFGLIRTADLILLVVDLQANGIEQLEETANILEEHRVILRGGAVGQAGDQGAFCPPCIVLVNKVDDVSWGADFEAFRDLVKGEWRFLPISVKTGHNLEQMKELIFETLGLIRVYSKEPGKPADRGTPFVLKRGSTVADFAGKVHKDFARNLKVARIWGTDVFDGQTAGREHILHDGDVVELHV